MLYYAYAGRVTDIYGVDVSAYAPPVSITGSLQAVPQNYYVQLGLDFQKTYVSFYCENLLQDIQRGAGNDIIVFNDKVYNVESLTDWHAIDGWVQAMCVLTDNPLPV